MYCTGEGVEKDIAAGARYYGLAAEAGHVHAMHNWGVMLLQGLGVEKDEAIGMTFIEKAGLAEKLAADESESA